MEDNERLPTKDQLIKIDINKLNILKQNIDELIPKLLNDKKSEKREFVQEIAENLFKSILDGNGPDLADYAEKQFILCYKNDVFAKKCGFIDIMKNIHFIFSSDWGTIPPVSYFMDNLRFKFEFIQYNKET